MMTTKGCTVLVLYDGKGPQIEAMASAAYDGVLQASGVRAIKKQLEEADREDLLRADALILGSPNWSGITGSMKQWLDDRGDLWEDGSLGGKIGAAFTTGRGRHSGLEFTLLSLIHWMLACGMIIVGLPWSERMQVSGSYYGATLTGEGTPQDLESARDLGNRVARLSLSMASNSSG